MDGDVEDNAVPGPGEVRVGVRFVIRGEPFMLCVPLKPTLEGEKAEPRSKPVLDSYRVL